MDFEPDHRLVLRPDVRRNGRCFGGHKRTPTPIEGYYRLFLPFPVRYLRAMTTRKNVGGNSWSSLEEKPVSRNISWYCENV